MLKVAHLGARVPRIGLMTGPTRQIRQTWELPSADDLFEAVLNATVRAAATLKAQRPEALKVIRQSVREAVTEYASGGVYRVPMPAVLATGTKPRTGAKKT